ncbi:MAG: hypothetical protein LBS74_02585 [Oscillospiraceae bacterium]|jgi:hypothetical protein|nr:hypothetical protein [Oscillospiraceae bacterium]
MVGFNSEAIKGQLALLKNEAVELGETSHDTLSVSKSTLSTFAGFSEALALLQKCVNAYSELVMLDTAKIEKAVDTLDLTQQGGEASL